MRQRPSTAPRLKDLCSLAKGEFRSTLCAHVLTRAHPRRVFLRQRRMLARLVAPGFTKHCCLFRLHAGNLAAYHQDQLAGQSPDRENLR